MFPALDWAIIAGLTVSTFLTMIVVPSVYAVLRRGGAQRQESQEQPAKETALAPQVA